MRSKSNRRRLRFSLSTLLLGVTVFCIYLAWQVAIVRERGAVRRLMTMHAWSTSLPVTQTASLSLVRRLLGDQIEFGDELYLNEGFPPEDVARIRAAFPESRITVIPSGAIERIR